MEKNKKVIILITLVIIFTSLSYFLFSLYFSEDKKIISKSIKINKNKDWIYSLETDTSKNLLPEEKEYNIDNKKIKLKNIVKMPLINIKSKDVEKANELIEEKFDNAIIETSTYLKNKEKNQVEDACENNNCGEYITTEYKYYLNKNKLSVVVIIKVGEEAENQECIAYNFNVKNGKQITYKEAAKELGISKEALNEKVKEKYYKEENKTEDMYNSYVVSVKNNESAFYYDKTGILHVCIPTRGQKENNTIFIDYKIE